jgi:hypothetical protein
VHLHSDDFWHFIRRGAIPPYLPEAHKQNEVVMGVLAQAAEGYAKGNYFVVVDGIVGPWFIHPFRRLGLPLHYIVLRPALDAAIEHCRYRGGDTLADSEVISALHKQFLMLDEFENYVIETIGQTRDDTLAAVQAGLVSGRFRLGAILELLWTSRPSAAPSCWCNGDVTPTIVPSDQSSCIKESQDSDNGDEQPRKKEHSSSDTGGNGPSFTPSKQRSRHTEQAEGDNDSVDEWVHCRYLHPGGQRVKVAEQPRSKQPIRYLFSPRVRQQTQ